MYLYCKSTTNRNGISTSLTRPTVLASHKILLVLLSMTMMMSKTAVALVPTTPMPSSTSHKISHNRRRAAYHGPLWYQHNHYQHHHAMLKSSAYDDNNETETAKTKSSSTASTMKIADFEYQELKIQIQAMKEQKVTSSQLQLPKRIELEGYVKRIVNRRASPIAMQDVAKYLPGTRWRLALSTESLMSQTLPKDSTITLQFAPSAANENGDMKVDYAIEFPKTLALKRLVAKSTCTVSVSPSYASGVVHWISFPSPFVCLRSCLIVCCCSLHFHSISVYFFFPLFRHRPSMLV